MLLLLKWLNHQLIWLHSSQIIIILVFSVNTIFFLTYVNKLGHLFNFCFPHHLKPVFLLIILRALASGKCVVDQADIQLLSPVTGPEKVVCVGMNYRDHCLEQNAPIPKEPIIFNKFPSAITGPYDDIILPSESQVRARLTEALIGRTMLTQKKSKLYLEKDKNK